MRRTALLACLTLLACSNGATTGVPLDQEFTLAPGQSIEVTGTGLIVTFRAVLEDSRCPSDAVCVWSGNGKVELVIAGVGPDLTADVNTDLEPRAASVGSYRIDLVALTPHPESDRQIEPGDYRARLKVTSP